jgi:hypothetical protein
MVAVVLLEMGIRRWLEHAQCMLPCQALFSLSPQQMQVTWSLLYTLSGRDSSVDIVTGYGLDGPGIQFRSGRDFLYPSTLGSSSLLYSVYRLIPAGEVAEAWR